MCRQTERDAFRGERVDVRREREAWNGERDVREGSGLGYGTRTGGGYGGERGGGLMDEWARRGSVGGMHGGHGYGGAGAGGGYSYGGGGRRPSMAFQDRMGQRYDREGSRLGGYGGNGWNWDGGEGRWDRGARLSGLSRGSYW